MLKTATLKNAWHKVKAFLTWKYVPEIVAAIVGTFGAVLAIIAGVASAVEASAAGSPVAMVIGVGTVAFVMVGLVWLLIAAALRGAVIELRDFFRNAG